MGKFRKRWDALILLKICFILRFHRNQPVIVECRDTGKFSGVITAVGTQEVMVSYNFTFKIEFVVFRNWFSFFLN